MRCTFGGSAPLCSAWMRSPIAGIGLGAALVVPDIFDPGRHVIGLDPQFRIFEVAHQLPLPRAVAPADAAALGHGVQEVVQCPPRG